MENNKEFSLESFIDWCDEMKITNEGAISNGIKKAFKEEPVAMTLGSAILIVSGLSIGGSVVKAKIKKLRADRLEKRNLKKLKDNIKSVYILSDKKMEGVYKASGKLYPEIDIYSALRNFIFTIPGSDDRPNDKKIIIHESFKSKLKTKFYLYTLDGSSIEVTNKPNLETSNDLPIKNIEEGTYEELLKNHGITIEINTINMNERKSMIREYSKEIFDMMKKDGVDKGISISDDQDYNSDFIYGLSRIAYLVDWDLWEFNKQARTDEEKNRIFYNAHTNAINTMNKKYPNIEFDECGDWDGGIITMTLKK